ncbi:hypothetical protein [Anaerocolumna sp. MB42-C2]|uniref:hypothetical protein n=1 Tax=Anaerocolumna sp. MB42-C2 TaxID=3070997 RepID=UPI0027E10363|nr:hypothetical protein [Anaerocolumna sp. MB42-C2]WMJ86253.1 hypothetical protein RBU59_19715 [Anaerocolumna sp. MB42-C2]
MITLENLMSIDKEQLPEAVKVISSSEIPNLVELLTEKNDKIRYQAFMLLQYRSQLFNDVYPYLENFRLKLKDNNSYQRSIGIMLIAENAKWDLDNKMDALLDDCLELLQDEKPITVRQCIQSLGIIAEAKPNLNEKISNKLMSINILEIKETMRKSVLLDILNVLVSIRKNIKNPQIDSFIFNSLSGGILDNKAIKQIENILI